MVDQKRSEDPLEHLRRWSEVAPSMSAQEAAQRVLQRLPPGRSPRRPQRRSLWWWSAAALIGVALWLSRPVDRLGNDVPSGRASGSMPSAPDTESTVVVMTLDSGTTLYFSPHLQGEADGQETF